MSEETIEVEQEESTESQLDVLKKRADLMGITYHPKIGVDKLEAKIKHHLSDDVIETVPETVDQKQEEVAVVAKPKAVKTTKKLFQTEEEYRKTNVKSSRRKAGALVRIRVNCMNPNKKDWEGEIISVGSAKLGTFKKFVPFNSEEGYHVPHIIYEAMKERKCTIFQTVKGPRGDKMRKGKLINEFAIETLDALTSEELKDLAQRQAMSGSIDS